MIKSKTCMKVLIIALLIYRSFYLKITFLNFKTQTHIFISSCCSQKPVISKSFEEILYAKINQTKIWYAKFN